MNKIFKKIFFTSFLSLSTLSTNADNIYPNINNFGDLLSQCLYGDTIFFPDSILNINEKTCFVVPYGVTIKTNTGRIKYTYFSYEQEYDALFLMKSKSSLIGLTLIGDNGEVNRPDKEGFYQNAVKTDGEDILISNCNFIDFDKWAVWGFNPSGLVVRNCRFENIRREGYGYGVWIGGKGGVWSKMSKIENNVFINCRSAVDGSGGYYSMTVQNNIFGEQQTYSTLARHGQGGSIFGGIHTFVFSNVVLNPVNRNLEIPYPAVDTGYVIVQKNMFTRTNSCWIGDTTMEGAPRKNKNVIVSNNSYTPIYDILSFSLKDNYTNYESNKVLVRVIVNGRIIDQIDLAGDDYKWKKYYYNITLFLITGTNSINIEFVINDKIDPKIYIDNIQLNRNESLNTSFENTMNLWRLTPNGFGTRLITEEFYDKIYSLRIQGNLKENKAILFTNFKR